MLETDLQGLWEHCRNSKECQLVLILLICFMLYYMLTKYMSKAQAHTTNITNAHLNSLIALYNSRLANGHSNDCNKSIPKMDEEIIKNMINLPNRNPEMLTSSMVVPNNLPSDEARRRTRMDILNMFYTSFDDDTTSVAFRPKGLYMIP